MTIEEQALELAELRRRADEALSADDIETWLGLVHGQASAVERLQAALLSESVHVVQSLEARRVLTDIDLSDIGDISAAGERLLYSWFTPQDYALGLSRVAALIAPVAIPQTLRSFVEEARQCYAFQHANAVDSLSRTILETAINDVCVRIGRMPRRVMQEDDFGEWPFRRRLAMVAGGETRLNRIHDHYKLLCRLVHGGTTVSSGEALTALAETLGFVHEVYAIHRHVIGNNA